MGKKERLTSEDVANNNNKFNLFLSIIESVKKYGKGTTIFGVIIFFLVTNLIVNPINLNAIIEKWNNKAELEHKLGIEKRQNADILVPNILNNILLKTNADRVMLLELHNGGTNKSNLPFYHFSASYEVINEDDSTIEYVSEQYQKNNTGDYGNVLSEIKKNRCLYIPDMDSTQSNRMTKRMKKNNVKSAYICSIYDDNATMIGILTITSSKPDAFDLIYLDNLTYKPCQQIGHLISGINNIIK